MDMGHFNLFIKMIAEEYKLTEDQLATLTHRMLADDQEFERIWRLYKSKHVRSGVDHFKAVLRELIS
jgi:hypothetical protein